MINNNRDLIMNYQLHYDTLINRAKLRILPLDQYTESHHIRPTCIGGRNIKANLVKLTPEEHFVAHQLLVKLYPVNPLILKACHIMTNSNSKVKRNNKLYGWIRKRLSILSSKRVNVDDTIYTSMLETSRVFNISADVVRHRCKSTKFPNWNYADGLIIKKIGIREINKINCDGILFPSTVQAALHFNISKDAVGHRCKSTKFPNWFIIGKEKTEETRNKRPNKGKILCDGVIFDDIYEAAKYFNVCTNSISAKCNSLYHENWNFLNSPIIKIKKVKKIPVCDSIEFASFSDAAKYFGITLQGVLYRCKTETFKDWYTKYLN